MTNESNKLSDISPVYYKNADFPEIDCVSNEYAEREYEVKISIPEFTCVCPVTGQPDFADFRITYIPGKKLIELKSLKLYIHSYRNVGIHHESAANKILDDLVATCNPRSMEVAGDFSIRGGIMTTVTASFGKKI